MLNLINSKNFIKEKILSVSLGIFSFLLIVFSGSMKLPSEDFKRALIPPPLLTQHFVFGFQEVMADALWIRAIQDLDYCEEKIDKINCKNDSWLYQMLELITSLSPNFRMPYAAGSLALTVIVSDIDGATKIFEKGVKAFPNDWPILYRAAYHFLYEVKDKKRAAELLIQAGKNGAPPFVFALAGRLYSDSGNVDLAETLLQEMIATEQDPVLIQRLKDKIQQIKAEKH